LFSDVGNTIQDSSVADPDDFDADPDPNYEKPDPDLDPALCKIYVKFCNKKFLLKNGL
jgi:hypothetical protein